MRNPLNKVGRVDYYYLFSVFYEFTHSVGQHLYCGVVKSVFTRLHIATAEQETVGKTALLLLSRPESLKSNTHFKFFFSRPSLNHCLENTLNYFPNHNELVRASHSVPPTEITTPAVDDKPGYKHDILDLWGNASIALASLSK